MINTNFEKMQKELLYLSVEQLQTLNGKVVEMLKLKSRLQSKEKGLLSKKLNELSVLFKQKIT